MNRTIAHTRVAPPSALERSLRTLEHLFHALPHRVVEAFRHERKARIIVSVCVAAFTTLGMVAILSQGTLMAVDGFVQENIIAGRQRWLDTAMTYLTFLGTRWVIGGLTAALAIWSLITGKHRRFTFVVVAAVLLNPGFEILFKELVGRARPDMAQLVPGNGPSFPSGHVLASAGFYGLVPFFVWEAVKTKWIRSLVTMASMFLILSIAISRVYLDVHWTTDAVAGLLLGAVLVAGFYHVFLETKPKMAAAHGGTASLAGKLDKAH